jgi:hypothetical protein
MFKYACDWKILTSLDAIESKSTKQPGEPITGTCISMWSGKPCSEFVDAAE